MALDQGLPRFNGEESIETKVRMLQDFQYQLVEQIRYALQNLDMRNFNQTEMGKWGKTITEPFNIKLEDADKNILQLQATAQGLAVQISDAEDGVAALELTAASLAARIANAEGNVTALGVTAKGLAAQISTQDGKIAALQMTADGLGAQISDVNGDVATLEVTAATLSSRISTQDGKILSIQQTADNLSITVLNLAKGQAAMLYVDAESGFIFSNETGEEVIINGGQLDAETVIAHQLLGENVWLLGDDGETVVGNMKMTSASSADYALELIGYKATRILANAGALHLRGRGASGPFITLDYYNGSPSKKICNIGNCALVLSDDNYGYSLPSSGAPGQIFILLES